LTQVTNPHVDSGTGTSPLTVTFSGVNAFTSASSFVCTAADLTGNTKGVKVDQTSGTSITVTAGTGGDTVNYICVGD
jgi:hypothetical protein